jgi:asparagine synthase (glutamine-hydrolysing)
MCGICGVVYADPARPVERALLQRMTDPLRHRGPDGEGFHVATGVGLGFRRLRIIDLETGDQPIANEDGSVIVVGNGEIYNFVELRKELEGAGHRFRTRSDIEVLVHLYEQCGLDFLSRLRGMFGFALWDARRRRLLLARDRFGIKPLLYAETAEGVFFGSEQKALLATGRVERRLDVRALEDLLTFSFVLAPRTLLRSVRQVLPGHYVLYERGALSEHRYWDLVFPAAGEDSPQQPAAAWAAELRAKLEESVRLHLRSDVPVGAWLSSGIDSSAVTSLMQSATAQPVSTFTLGFENPRFDEVQRNRILSDFPSYGLVNHRVVCTTRDFEQLRRAIWHAEDPQAVGLEIPRLLLSELSARHVKVVLSGEGSDEVFGGYPWFWTHKLVHPLTRLPLRLRSLVARIPALRRRWPRAARILGAPAEMGLARYQQTIETANHGFDACLFSGELRRALAEQADDGETLRLPEGFERWHSFSQLQYLETRVRLPNFVTRLLDSLSMAHGLEVRVPFLDHELVELCARIPPALKLRGRREKYILRRAIEADLPAEIVWRKKRGLAAPFSQWLRELPAFALDLLSTEQIRRRGHFEPRVVARLLAEHRAGDANHAKSLLGVLAIHLWHDLFLDRAAEESAPC